MKKQEEEEWRIVPQNKNYEVSNFGRVRNKKKKNILTNQIRSSGYESIGLSSQNRVKKHLIHRLVARAFIPNPNKFPFVNHKDRNRSYNRVENLEWVNQSMNMKHSIESGAKRYKRAVWLRNLESKEVKEFNSLIEAAKAVGCTPENISASIKRNGTSAGFKWGFVEKKIKEEAREDIPWKEIDSYPGYRIYNNGQIYSDKTNKYINLRIRGGYYRINLYHNNIRRTYSVHRLIAQYFCENLDKKPIVNHKDGNKLNNHYTNLEWVTQSENVKHSYSLGLQTAKRINQYARKDKDKRVILCTFNNIREATESVKFKSRGTISSIMTYISMACTDVRNTAYSYRWGYEKI
uniref:HNH endonuclease n=1 Tax=Iridovirus LCIVAC01 TaxID=2506607 RepID=A0A481YQ50_9VIRU|nr:MAG: HNH endonuclease [Iridovirus LCIVAC01]